jgi:hypothetical protein
MSARAAALDQRRPRVEPLSSRTGTDRQLDPQLQPWALLLPSPFIHADFAASSALAVADKQSAAAVIEIGFGEAEGFLDP